MKKLLLILCLVLTGCSSHILQNKPLDVTYDMRKEIVVNVYRECVEYDYGGNWLGGVCSKYSDVAKLGYTEMNRDFSESNLIRDLGEAAIAKGDEKKIKKYAKLKEEWYEFYSGIECIPDSEYVDVDTGSVNYVCTYNKEYADDLGIKVINSSFNLPYSMMKSDY